MRRNTKEDIEDYHMASLALDWYADNLEHRLRRSSNSYVDWMKNPSFKFVLQDVRREASVLRATVLVYDKWALINNEPRPYLPKRVTVE